MKKYVPILTESLPLWYAKKITKGWHKERAKEMFNGEYRFYLPLINSPKEEKINSKIEPLINKELKIKGYRIHDYISGLASKIDDPKRIMRIGKLIDPDSELSKKFQNDPLRSSSKGASPIVVISRHPYDISGMSTDRGWTSCMQLPFERFHSKKGHTEQGSFVEKISAARKFCLIAYLIRPDDKNIENPIARVLLVPYHMGGLTVYVLANKIYGTSGKYRNSFKTTIKQWLDEKQKNLPKGKYILNDQIYNDDDDEEYWIGDEDEDDEEDSILSDQTKKDLKRSNTLRSLNDFLGDDGIEFINYYILKDGTVYIKSGKISFKRSKYDYSKTDDGGGKIKFGKGVILEESSFLNNFEFDGVIFENCGFNYCKFDNCKISSDNINEDFLDHCEIENSEIKGMIIETQNKIINCELKNCLWKLNNGNIFYGTSTWNNGLYTYEDSPYVDGSSFENRHPDTMEALYKVAIKVSNETNRDIQELLDKWSELSLQEIDEIIKSEGKDYMGNTLENVAFRIINNSTKISTEVIWDRLPNIMKDFNIVKAKEEKNMGTIIYQYKENPSYFLKFIGTNYSGQPKKLRIIAYIKYGNKIEKFKYGSYDWDKGRLLTNEKNINPIILAHNDIVRDIKQDIKEKKEL